MCLRKFSTVTTDSLKKFTGRYKWWKKPIYVQPVVHPLKQGPDFSFVDGPSPRITHISELKRRQEQAQLAEQIVKCLAEVREAEELHAIKKHAEERSHKTKERWTLTTKGTTEFC